MPDHSGETYDWVREHITGELSAKAGRGLSALLEDLWKSRSITYHRLQMTTT